jgi:UDP-N-acetylmuramate--alanine ligase
LLCERLGCDLDAVARALCSFKGIQRRLERIGESRGVVVIDDYAHNPAKIGAAWQTVASHHERVFGIWRPHGYGPLSAMMEALVAVLADRLRGSDRLYVLPVFDAGGTADRTVRSEILVDRLAGRGLPAAVVRDTDAMVEEIAGRARAGDAVLTMGARDPHLPALARRLLQALLTGQE